MKNLFYNLGQLLREGDSRALEFVVGLLLTTLGLQYAGVAVTLLPAPPSTQHLRSSLLGMLGTLMIVSGIIKVLGAVLNDVSLRIVAAITGAVSWLYLIFMTVLTASPLTTLLWIILFSQSAWIYVRLSLLQKQKRVS
jgi:hypothetical protein